MGSKPIAVSGSLQFGDDFELNVRAYELRSGGIPLKLKPIAMELLLLLVERRGELVTRDQIVERIWGKGVFLDTDNSINGAINKIRQVLRDDAEQPRFIQTVSGRGYRFIAPVMEAVPLPAPETAVQPPNPESLIGRKISHYRILQFLGGGGMGVVYKAEDLKLGRRVAIKFLPAEMAGDPKAFERLEREARAASALEHPNICPIYELGEHEGQPFIVMQLLEGQTLQERIENAGQQKKPVPAHEVLDLALQIVAGLEAAHEKGIIHRDIKPANIFLTNRGEVKILDFGLAKIVEPEFASDNAPDRGALAETSVASEPREVFSNLRLTRTGTTVGTAHYMSPEQVRGETLDARTDLFSFGLVLYEMATGQRAFPGNTVAVVHDAILHATPLPILRLNPELSDDLEPIITKALEKDRNLRYQSAADMRTDLRGLKRDTDSHPSSAVAAKDVGRGALVRPGRAKLGNYILVVALVALLVSGGLYYRSHGSKPLTEKDTIVLADFANSTGDPIFDDTLKTALNVSLRQSPFLNVLSDSQVAKTLQLMTRPADTKLAPDVARELCQRAGSKAYIAGTVGSLGSEYVLGLKAVNCQSGDTLAEDQVTAASREKVLDALGEAASKLRGELGESLPTVEKFDVRLAQATTSSLEALKAYSLADRASHENGSPSELSYHLRAIELDPNFAMGYEKIGEDYFNLAELGRAREYYSKAFELQEHVSEREKLVITSAYYSNVTGELEKAARTYQEWIENYPRDSGSHHNLGNVYAMQGQWEKAREAYGESLRLSPNSSAHYSSLANTLLALQRFEEGRRITYEAKARKLDDSIAHTALYGLAFVASDSSAMAEEQQWFAGQPDVENAGLSLASDSEAYAGHLGKARELTQRSVDSAIHADSKESGAIWLENAALREAAFGNTEEAKRAAEEGLKLAPNSQGVQDEAALAFAMAGDAPRAESIAKDLNKSFPVDSQMQSLWLAAIQGQLALDRKHPADALNTLQAGDWMELGQIMFINNLSCLYPTYVRGKAYLSGGQGSAAAVEFQKILEHSGIVWNCWTGALAHLGLARANALQSRTSQGVDADAARVRALAAYKDFLTLWKDADPDLPILKLAKAEYTKLQ